jgi:transposase
MSDKLSTLFVGVDIHKETHTLAAANVACEKICDLTFANSPAGFKEALQKITETARQNSLKPLIGLEDTGGNGSHFARFLLAQGLPVKTVNPVWVKRNRSKSTHPEKSDSRSDKR